MGVVLEALCMEGVLFRAILAMQMVYGQRAVSSAEGHFCCALMSMVQARVCNCLIRFLANLF